MYHLNHAVGDPSLPKGKIKLQALEFVRSRLEQEQQKRTHEDHVSNLGHHLWQQIVTAHDRSDSERHEDPDSKSSG